MIRLSMIHPDGVVVYRVDIGTTEYWLRFERTLDDEEQQLLAATAQVGTLEAVRTLELPFWDVPSTGGPSWYHV